MNELRTFKAADLVKADLQPPRFIVSDILPTGFVILAAPPKSGKSWLALSIADAVASGQTFWGYKTDPGPVLYLALEDSPYRLQSRLNAIGSTIPPNLQFAINGANTINGGLVEQLQIWTTNNPGAKVIIIDTIGRVKNGGKPGMNAYEADTQMYAALQQFAIRQSICILAVSHFSKTKLTADIDPFEKITGSMGAFGVADAAWIICGQRGKPQQTLRITGRDINDASFQITFDKCIWSLDGSTADLERQALIDAYKLSPVVKTIRKLVRENGAWEGTAADLIACVWKHEQSCTINTMQKMGLFLRSNKQFFEEIDGITFSQNPGGRKGRGYRFTLTSPIP